MSKSNLPQEFLNSAQKCNFDKELFKKEDIPHLYVESNKVLSLGQIPGIKVITKTFRQGVKIKLIVLKGREIEKPIFFCFGLLQKKAKQIILPEIILEENSKAKIFAHCTFPFALNITHTMKAKLVLKKGAQLIYEERHYHGDYFGANVLPSFEAILEKEASLENYFILNQGTVGKLKINFKAKLKEKAISEITTRIIGKGEKDDIFINDKIILEGENSRSLIKIRAAAVDGGKVFGQGETIALAKNAQGHVDCQEIVIGKKSICRAVPIVEVKHPEARITHEASVGKISQKELEVLMTRGLSEKEAIDFIIRGKLD